MGGALRICPGRGEDVDVAGGRNETVEVLLHAEDGGSDTLFKRLGDEVKEGAGIREEGLACGVFLFDVVGRDGIGCSA